MAVKLADTLQAMADFPVAMASGINIVKEDDTEKDLQQMYEDGELGGESMPMPLSANMLLVSENDETSGDLIWSQIDKSEVGSVPLICTEEEWEDLDPKPVEGTEVIITDDEIGSISELMKAVYPVGSVYISVNNINPSTFISGTTWERLAKGRTLWNVEDNQIGGDLISAGIPNITGGVSYGIPANNAIGVVTANGAFSGTTPQQIGAPTSGSIVTMSPGTKFVASSGETKTDGTIKNDVYGKSDTVQPPSIGVYMWKRTV